jgi:acetyl esterase/lipase
LEKSEAIFPAKSKDPCLPATLSRPQEILAVKRRPSSTGDVLTRPQPSPDERVSYGADPNQFIDLRLPHAKGPHPAVMNIHGGFWRAKYDLSHAGHLCEALRGAGVATFNIEYRRVGNPGGGWPGTFEDIRSAYRFVRQNYSKFHLDLDRLAVIGHSAGGQLALCLAAHDPSVRNAISLAGVVDLRRGFALHLSNDAVQEFLGGKPDAVPEHYREADPLELAIQARQWLLHGTADDTVPPELSRDYVMQKKKSGELVQLIEIPRATHFDLIDPASEAWKQVLSTAQRAVAPSA